MSHSQMRRSLEPLSFSTRLKNALTNLTGYPDVFAFEDVVKAYAEDPVAFEEAFLRTPGVGRQTWHELHQYLEDHAFLNDTVGRIGLISLADAEKYRRSIDRVLHGVDTASSEYQDLRSIQETLRSSTVMIEQPEDARSEFRKE